MRFKNRNGYPNRPPSWARYLQMPERMSRYHLRCREDAQQINVIGLELAIQKTTRLGWRTRSI